MLPGREEKRHDDVFIDDRTICIISAQSCLRSTSVGLASVAKMPSAVDRDSVFANYRKHDT